MTLRLINGAPRQPDFRWRALGKLITVLAIWACLTFSALVALSTGDNITAKYLICATIAFVPGGTFTGLLELQREWRGIELTPERNLIEHLPLLASAGIAFVTYFTL